MRMPTLSKVSLSIVALLGSACLHDARRFASESQTGWQYSTERSRSSDIILDTIHPCNAFASFLLSLGRATSLRPRTLSRSRHLQSVAMLDYDGPDPYKLLEVSRTATAAEIKKTYRKLALRSHPDVNNAPDADKTYQKILAAYEVLSDPETRRQYDYLSASGSSSRSSSGSSSGSSSSRSSGSWDPSDPFGSNAFDPGAAERYRRWREDNPSPDQLNDSFGSLFSDAASAVFKAVSGRGDWISLLEELMVTEGQELDSLLRSRDVSMLEEELENSQWVQQALDKRIRRLNTELSDDEADLKSFREDRSSARSMSRTYERELEGDVKRSRERLRNAKNLVAQARTREQRIETRIRGLRNEGSSGGSGSSYRTGGSSNYGSGGSSSSSRSSNSNYRSSGSQSNRGLLTVDEELAALKKSLGK